MYLKHFTYDGKNCYTKNKQGKINSQSIKEICKRKYIYEFKNEKGEIFNRNLVENTLSKTENYYNPLLINMFSYFDTLENGSIITYSKDIEREGIFAFFCSMILRNPVVMKEAPWLLKRIGIETNETMARNVAINNNLYLLIDYSNYIEKRFNIIIHRNLTNVPFITSDMPIAGIKLNAEHHIMYMPLSPKYFLILTPRELVGKTNDIFIENKHLNVNFFNQFFSYKNCEKISISNKKEFL